LDVFCDDPSINYSSRHGNSEENKRRCRLVRDVTHRQLQWKQQQQQQQRPGTCRAQRQDIQTGSLFAIPRAASVNLPSGCCCFSRFGLKVWFISWLFVAKKEGREFLAGINELGPVSVQQSTLQCAIGDSSCLRPPHQAGGNMFELPV
jgi:hypothetical protein